MTHDPLDDLLRSAATDTRTVLGAGSGASLPPFEPNSNRAGSVVAVIVALIVVGVGGWFLGSMPDDAVELETADNPAEAVNPPDSSVPDGRIDDALNDQDGVDDEAAIENTVETTIPPVEDLEVREQPELAKPAFGEPFIDPAFGSAITRVTNTASGERIIPVQSPAAVWNADESLMLLYQTSADMSGHVFLDAQTFEVVGELDVVPTDIEHVFWHPTNPDLIVTTVDLDLVTVSVSTGDTTTIASYPQCDWVDPGVGTAGPSWDGSLIALRCGNGSATQVLSQPLDGSPAASLDVADGEQGMASPDGQSIIIETADRFEIYDAALTEVISDIDWAASAPTVAVDGNGNSVILSAGFEADFPGSLVIAQLNGGSGESGVADGSPVEVIVGPDTGYPFPRSGSQVAANGWNAPGLLVSASPVPAEVQAGGPIETFDGEVVIADLRTTPPTIQRVAHTRNFATDAFSRTAVTLSPSGRFVAFASDWGGDATDTYVIDLEAEFDG